MSIAHPDQLQRQAAHPEACVWVAASAGTGKTKVLTDRVLNLLLAGTPPHRILCLTFTRAAAGEMQNRLSQKLSEWVIASDDELRTKLTQLLGDQPTEEQFYRAKRLFPIVLDSPGGMKIQTIHGFCQSILKRFPLEAKLSPHFSVMDENETQLMLAQIQANVLQSESNARTYLYQLTDVLDDLTFQEMLSQLIAERHRLAWILNQQDGIAKAREQLELMFDLSLDEDEMDIKQAAICEECFSHQALAVAAKQLQLGSKTDVERGDGIARWLEKPTLRVDTLNKYMGLYLTQSGEIRKKLATNGVVEKNPRIIDTLMEEAERLYGLQEKLHSLRCAQKSWAALNLGLEVIKAYTFEKQRRGLLDYDDLIQKTASLLSTPDVAPWVLYKLDGGLDHILVDEAQDTNHHQWTVISALAEEFFAGEGAQDLQRTLFVVGDAKQSIYSFQGANPYVFDLMRKRFTQTQQNWQQVNLNTSFRSTEAVLQIVDKTFEDLTAREGVAIQEDFIEHQSFRQGQGGLVELWPLVEPIDTEEIESWSSPSIAQEDAPSPTFRLAYGIAGKIKHWIDTKEILASKGRPIRPKDILILVRRRTAFVDTLVRALKQSKIPVAGTDRLELLSHLAIQDLLALGEFVIQPLDDLNLASLLKSPIVGLDEEELFDLAHNRGDKPLWYALIEKKKSYIKAYHFLINARNYGQENSPFEFYAQVLGTWQGRQKLVGRLGSDILDPLEEFLNLLHQYQSSNTPTMLGFLSWIQRGEVQIKRDLEQSEQDEIKIMTVHGAKGLQAPIVFLPDTVQIPRSSEKILWAAYKDQKDLPIWSPSLNQDCMMSKALKLEAQNNIEQEYRRLLYVAMTRAEDRLYVCGWKSQNEISETSWYNLISKSLQSTGKEFNYDNTNLSPYGWQGAAWRHACPQLIEVNSIKDQIEKKQEIGLPKWAKVMPYNEQSNNPVIRPSQLEGQEISFMNQGVDRGTIIHKLLQYLPEAPQEKRQLAAEQLLKVNPSVPDEQRSEIIESVLNVLKTEQIKDWFGPNSMAEVPISGEINGKMISGQVDRICVINGEVIIIDYKTNRKPPTNVEEIPTVYLHQLAAYKEILQRIYSHHTIRCVLLWTETLKVMEIPQYLLSNEIENNNVKNINTAFV